MDIANLTLGKGTLGAQGQDRKDDELDHHDSDDTTSVDTTVGDDITLTLFPIDQYFKTKTKLGRGAFGTVRV